MIVTDRRKILLGGCWILGEGCHVRRAHCARIVVMCGGTLNYMRGGTLNYMDRGTLNNMEGGTLNNRCGGVIINKSGGTIVHDYTPREPEQ